MKDTAESKVYKSLAEIEETFVLEQSKLVERRMNSGGKPDQEASARPAAAASGAIELDQAQNPVFLLKRQGFELGKLYRSSDGMIWEISAIEEDLTTGKSVRSGVSPGWTPQVKQWPTNSMKSFLRPFKGSVLSIMDGDIVEAHSFHKNSTTFEADRLKFNAYNAILTAMEENEPDMKFVYTVNPKRVWSSCRVEKGELVLVPALTGFKDILTKESQGPRVVRGKDAFWLQSIVKPDKAEVKDDRAVFDPFWFVTEAAADEAANMRVHTIVVEGWKITVWKNFKAIEAYTPLLFEGKSKKTTEERRDEEDQKCSDAVKQLKNKDFLIVS